MSDLVEVDLASLPRMGAVRKINNMVRRIREIRTLTLILDHLRHKMGSRYAFGKDKKKKQLLENLPAIFREVMKLHDLSPGDFPNIEQFKRYQQI